MMNVFDIKSSVESFLSKAFQTAAVRSTLWRVDGELRQEIKKARRLSEDEPVMSPMDFTFRLPLYTMTEISGEEDVKRIHRTIAKLRDAWATSQSRMNFEVKYLKPGEGGLGGGPVSVPTIRARFTKLDPP